MEWISIKERIPEIGQFIAIISSDQPSFYWMGTYLGYLCDYQDLFTHWIILPIHPSEVSKNIYHKNLVNHTIY